MSLMMGHKDTYVAPVEKEGMLYYYCSMKTFISIIEKGSVWLRDLRDMNDPNEMMLGNEDWAQNILMAYETNKFRFEYNGKKDSEGMWDYLMNSRIKKALRQYSLYDKIYYAICFTSSCDALSLWRMYADNGHGVCLAFDKSITEEYVRQTTGSDKYKLLEIEYGETRNIKETIAKNMLEEIKSEYNDQERNGDIKKDIEEIIGENINTNWAKYKDKAYADEKETRLVYSIDSCYECDNGYNFKPEFLNKIVVSTNDGKIDPHIEVNADVLGLKEVILGPCNNASRLSMELLLQKYNKHYSLFKSKIAYRG